MNILFIEPFFGGSHQDFALGFKEHSRHTVTLVTLPDSGWKWRMRGAACYFADRVPLFSEYDAIFVTDMMNLCDLKSLGGPDFPPVLLYFHENQLSYPLSAHLKQEMDLGWTNLISAAAADKVLFNSNYHCHTFLTSAKTFIRQMPDARPLWLLETIQQKTDIAYPGCWFPASENGYAPGKKEIPLIIWNHRWDHDKRFIVLYDVLKELKAKQVLFRLALLGERFENYPEVFKKARLEFKNEIVVFDFVSSKEDYISWLKQGHIIVSCAIQENFGISVIEAIRYGCLPLLPERLSYPELIPDRFHPMLLYRNKKELETKLADMLTGYDSYLTVVRELSDYMRCFSWQERVRQFDNLLEEMTRHF